MIFILHYEKAVSNWLFLPPLFIDKPSLRTQVLSIVCWRYGREWLRTSSSGSQLTMAVYCRPLVHLVFIPCLVRTRTWLSIYTIPCDWAHYRATELLAKPVRPLTLATARENKHRPDLWMVWQTPTETQTKTTREQDHPSCGLFIITHPSVWSFISPYPV